MLVGSLTFLNNHSTVYKMCIIVGNNDCLNLSFHCYDHKLLLFLRFGWLLSVKDRWVFLANLELVQLFNFVQKNFCVHTVVRHEPKHL
jgi:hypothetical protein